ncbi:MAG: ATP-binding protein [Eubacteriales bacterium]|nr:ATP-binding protein [Eubacteriales bacterium]
MEEYVNEIILNEYKRRIKAANEAYRSLQARIYREVEGLMEIDREIGLLGLKLAESVLASEKGMAGEKAATGNAPSAGPIEREMDALRKKRENLITSAGYGAGKIRTLYKCRLCRDTGYVEDGGNTVKCVCYNEMRQKLLYELSNLKSLRDCLFRNFNENYYPVSAEVNTGGVSAAASPDGLTGSHSTEPSANRQPASQFAAPHASQPASGSAASTTPAASSTPAVPAPAISPRENILRIRDVCLDFIENFDDPSLGNLFFSGSAGVGKSFMAGCVGHELLRRKHTVLYYSAPKMFDVIARYRMNYAGDASFDRNEYDFLYKADLLIIDDLGTEAPSSSKFSELLNLLNFRSGRLERNEGYSGLGDVLAGDTFQKENDGIIVGGRRNAKPYKTVISSNMGVRDLYEYYDERIASRIIGNFHILRFVGDDIRMIKKREGVFH